MSDRRLKNRIRAEVKNPAPDEKDKKQKDSFNSRVLSPYSYIKYYNKLIETMDPQMENSNNQKNQILQNKQTFNKVVIPEYLEKEHAKKEMQRNNWSDHRGLTIQEKQELLDEMLIQKRTEELLNKIAENNKQQNQYIFRTHSVIPKIIKNSDMIDFIDQTQKKYFSISRQIMNEINKHKKQKSLQSPASNYFKADEPQGFTQAANKCEEDLQKRESIFKKKKIPQIQKIMLANKLVKQNSFDNNNQKLTSRSSSSFIKINDGISQSQNGQFQNLSRQNSVSSNQQLMVRTQLRNTITQEVSEELKNLKQIDIQNQKQEVQEKYQKKLNHIQKNKNPQYFMSKSVLDRKNITLRKILSSIPYQKLSQIYNQKIQNFKETLFKQKSRMDQLKTPLKKMINPTFNHHISSNPLLVSLLTSKYHQNDKSKTEQSENTFEQKTDDNIIEDFDFQFEDKDAQKRESQNQCKSLLLHKKSLTASLTKQPLSTSSYESFQRGKQLSISEQNQNKFHKIDFKNNQNIIPFQSQRSIKSNSQKLSIMNVHSQRGAKIENQFGHLYRNSSIESDKQSLNKQWSGQQTKQNIQQTSEKHQKSMSIKISPQNENDSTQKSLRVKNKTEVDSKILEKKQRRYTDLSNSANLKQGAFSTFYTSKFCFKDSGKQFNVKDKLQEAFDEYLDNDEILTSPRSRQETLSSSSSNPNPFKRKVTISDQFSSTYRQNQQQSQSEKISIFDNNHYFSKRYSPTAGFSLKLSQSAHDLNIQFEKIIQKQIQGIDSQIKNQNKHPQNA